LLEIDVAMEIACGLQKTANACGIIHVREQQEKDYREETTNQIERPFAIYKRKGLIFLGGLRISSENRLEKFLQ